MPPRRLLLRWSALLALLLLASGGTLVAYRARHQEAELAARYRTQKVTRGNLTQLASANGTLNPVVLVNVGTQVSGTVQKWYADFNDRVRKGQVLLELDPSLYRAQVGQSEANLNNARSQLKLAQANAARAQALFRQEYISRQELDTAVQAQEAARAQVALTQAQLDKDRTNLNYSVIRSPVSGVVVSREVDIGQTVAASFQTPTLFKIAQDLSKMQIDSSYAEADVGQLRVGQEATFRVDAFPSRLFKGVVRQVRLNPTTVQNVVTYDVVVAVDNPDQVLMPGMTAYVNILIASRQNALLLPNAALRFRPAEAERPKDGAPRGNTVYVLDHGRPVPVAVTVGITDNRLSEITGGPLREGTEVIIEDRQPPARQAGSNSMRLF